MLHGAYIFIKEWRIQMIIYKGPYKNIVFLINSMGDETEEAFEHDNRERDWYFRNLPKSDAHDWLCYLVTLDGQSGLWATMELSNPRSDRWANEKSAYPEQWQSANYNEGWNHLKGIAAQYDNQLKKIEGAAAYLGEMAGIFGRHELNIFFPFETADYKIKLAFLKIAKIPVCNL
jgi:hypothetical protein